MRRILACAAAALLSACSILPTDGGPREVVPGREFTLNEGRIALVRGPQLSVEFLGVTDDDRCPIEAVCVSAGDATVRLRLSEPGRDPQVVELRTESAPYATYGSHGVQLYALDPPRSISEPDPDYRVRLRVLALAS